MVFTSVRDSITDAEFLINLEQLCYIKRDSEDNTYELWFTQEKGLGLNGITVDQNDADKIFALIKAFAKDLESAETEFNTREDINAIP